VIVNVSGRLDVDASSSANVYILETLRWVRSTPLALRLLNASSQG